MTHDMKKWTHLVAGILMICSVSVPNALATRMVINAEEGYFLVDGQKMSVEDLVFLVAMERQWDVDNELRNAFYEQSAECKNAGACLDENLITRLGNRRDLAIQLSTSLMRRSDLFNATVRAESPVAESHWNPLLAELFSIGTPLWKAETPPVWGGQDLPTGIFQDQECNPAVAPVPEPGTIFLLGVGILGIAGLHRNRFRQK